MSYYIGLDLGGTNVKAGLVNDQAEVLGRLQVPSEVEAGSDRIVQVMAGAAGQVCEQAGIAIEQVSRVGIGTPGSIDFERGLVVSAPNLPSFVDFPLRDRIAEKAGVPAELENDANAAAFGEFWAGAGRDKSIRHMIMLTLGTGIGSGVIVDGRLVRGGFGYGGEGGHMIIVADGRLCNCGQRGCLEAYASATNTGKRAGEAVAAGESSALKVVLDRTGQVTSKEVFGAAAAGDGLAGRIVQETAGDLGIACVNICRIFDPQMIVFAGGMILAGDALFNAIRTAYREHNWKMVDTPVQIVPAALGNDAGFIGAAAVAWDADQNR